MNVQLAKKRQNFHVRLRREHIDSVTRTRRQQLMKEEATIRSHEQISSQEIMKVLKMACQDKNDKKTVEILEWILKQGTWQWRELIKMGLLNLIASSLEVKQDLLTVTILKTFAFLTNMEGIQPNQIQHTTIIDKCFLALQSKGLNLIRYSIVVYSNCCLQQKLKKFVTIGFEKIVENLQNWLKLNILDELTAELVCFFRCYLEFVDQKDIRDSDCNTLLRYCFYILRQKFFEILYENYQPKILQDILKIIQTLSSLPAGSVQSIKYPYDQLIQILQCQQSTPTTKKSILLILGQSFYQSDTLSLELVQSLPIIPLLRTTIPFFPVLTYQILGNLATLNQLSEALSGICFENAIRYILEENLNLKTHIFLMLRNYCQAQKELPVGLLKTMAENTEGTMVGEEVRFWAEMVCNRGYRGNVPNYVLMETEYEEAYKMRQILEID